MKEEDYRRFVSKLVPDAGMKNRLSGKVARSASAKRKRITAWAAAACVIAAAIAVPLLLNAGISGTEIAAEPSDSTEATVSTPNSVPAVQPSETAAGIRVIYGSSDYSSIYDGLIAARPVDDLNGGIEENTSPQTPGDPKREYADRYSNKESVTITDESSGYIYSAANRTVSVSDKDGNVISWVECGSDRSFLIKSEDEEEIGVYEYYRELFLQSGRLYALKSVIRVTRADWGGRDYPEPEDLRKIRNISQKYTLLEVYDVSAPEEISFIKEIALSGAYYDILLKDGSISVFTCYEQSEWLTDKTRPETYVPMCYTENVMRVFGTDDIYHLKEYDGSHIPGVCRSYFTGVSVKTEALEPQSKIAVNGSYEAFYFGNSAIYMLYCKYTYEYDETVHARFNYTEIIKIANTDGKLTCAQGRVRGTIPSGGNGPSLLNEDNGFLTIAVHVGMAGKGKSEDDLGNCSFRDDNGKPYPNYFAFYTLDSDLNIVGTVDKIGYVSGKWLDLAAARREGSIVYIVGSTGYQEEQVKKLFMIDISNPANPVLLNNDTLDDVDKTIEWVCETEEQ